MDEFHNSDFTKNSQKKIGIFTVVNLTYILLECKKEAEEFCFFYDITNKNDKLKLFLHLVIKNMMSFYENCNETLPLFFVNETVRDAIIEDKNEKYKTGYKILKKTISFPIMEENCSFDLFCDNLRNGSLYEDILFEYKPLQSLYKNIKNVLKRYELKELFEKYVDAQSNYFKLISNKFNK